MSHPVGPEGLLNLEGVQDPSERPTELGDVEGEVGDGGREDVQCKTMRWQRAVRDFLSDTLCISLEGFHGVLASRSFNSHVRHHIDRR